MTEYDLNATDVTRLEGVAERISGPIVEIVALLAGERDDALALLTTTSAQARDWGVALYAAVDILRRLGYEPTYALDRDAWASVQAASLEVPEPGDMSP